MNPSTKDQLFEYNVAALLYLRSLQRANDFVMGCNLEGFGAFGDLFLKMSWKIKDEPHAVFIQLKRMMKQQEVNLNHLLGSSGNFSLLKDFYSYCCIEEKIKNPEGMCNGHIYSGLDFDKCAFVLFTNCDVEHKSDTFSQHSKLDSIFSTGEENEDIFSFDQKDKEVWDLREGHEDCEKYRTFLKRFRVYSGQTDKLCELVRTEVGICSQLQGADSDCLYSSFISSLDTWWNDSDTFLTDNSPHWKQALMEHLNLNMIHNLECIHYEFKPELLHYLDDTPIRDAFLNVIIPGIDERTRCFKIFAHLERKYSGNYLLMSENDVVQKRNQVMLLCRSAVCKVLVINTLACSKFLENENELEPQMCTIILMSANKLNPGPNRCQYIEEKWTFEQLPTATQQLMLKTNVVFQGVEVPLESICGSEVRGELGGKVLSAFLCGNTSTVGKPLPPVKELYISRMLHHQTVLREDVLKHTHTDDIFAISRAKYDLLSVDVSELKDKQNFQIEKCDIQNIINLSYCESETSSGTEHADKIKFVELCNNYGSNKNIHWLEFKDDFLVWNESYGNKATPRQFIQHMSSNCGEEPICIHEAEQLEDWSGKLVVVTGDPGIGKSALLHSVAVNLKRKNPTSWVIHISLSDYTAILQTDSISYQHVEDILVRAVSEQSTTDSDLERCLLRDSLKTTGNLTVLLDGLDEISSNNMVQVLQMVHLLVQTNVSHLWLSSRRVLHDYLRRELSTLPLLLEPFTDEQQKLFIIQYLVQQATDSNNDLIEVKAKDLLEFTNSTRSVLGRHICDVPLHAMMVSSIATQIQQANGDLMQETLTFNAIYKGLLTKKCEYYYRKREDDTTITGLTEREEDSFEDIHMKYAMSVVFTPEERTEFDLPNYEDDDVALLSDGIDKENTGIIDGHVNNMPRFVHFTFAEYFAAKWFLNDFLSKCSSPNHEKGAHLQRLGRRIADAVSRVKSSLSNRQHYNKSMYEYLLLSKFKFLRRLFDEMLSDGFHLHEAALIGNSELVTRLLASGSSVDGVDRGGRLPLHLAAAHGSSNVVKLLLSAGSPVSALDHVLGWTPLRYADRLELWDVADQLLQFEANDEDMTVLRTRILQHSEVDIFIAAASAGLLTVIKLMLRLDTEVNIKQSDGCTALYSASRHGHNEIVNLLLEHKADVSIVNSDGWTPLHAASRYGHHKIVQNLIEHKADTNTVNGEGWTPLHAASRHGYSKIVETLLEHKADVKIVNGDGWIPLYVAARYGHSKIVQMLLEHDSDVNVTNCDGWSPLHVAARYGYSKIVQVLLEHNSNVNVTNCDGWTPLHVATRFGHSAAILPLLDHGCDINYLSKDNTSPLLLAVQYGHVNIVQLLIQNRADVNVETNNGNTALICAALSGNIDIIRLLLEHGVDVNCRNLENNTAIHVSVEHGHLEAVRILLNGGANVKMTNAEGSTALDIAQSQGHADIEQLISDTTCSTSQFTI